MIFASRLRAHFGGVAIAGVVACALTQHALAQDGVASPEAGAAVLVKFVSYNLKNYLKMDRREGGEFLENAPKPEAEIGKVVEFLVSIHPDVIGVCEIGSEADVIDLQSRLKAAGLYLPHREWVDAADSVRHVAALSRFPFSARDHQTTLRYQMDDKEFEFNRGILDATVQINPDYKLRLLGIHLKSKREVKEGDQALMRRNEAHLLRTHVDNILKTHPDENVIMYGDFNDTRNETPIKVLQGKFGRDTYMRDIQVADQNGFRWTYYWSYADIYSRFDFAFVSKGLYPEVIQEKSYIFSDPDWFTASDHRPIVIAVSPNDAAEGSARK
jgi:endonuclease/exonuclease/phosphatase family metal-dependent hydrolase